MKLLFDIIKLEREELTISKGETLLDLYKRKAIPITALRQIVLLRRSSRVSVLPMPNWNVNAILLLPNLLCL